jgi:hypothetical protein
MSSDDPSSGISLSGDGAITGAHWAFEDGTEWGDLEVPSSETDLLKIADAIEKPRST